MDINNRILGHPANQGIIACLKHIARNWRGPLSCHPSEAYDPYYHLGTHPDLVERLWDKLTVKISVDCRWVLHARPVLIHPETGIVFAFATGTHTYALRIPQAFRPQSLLAKAGHRYEYPGGKVLELSEYDGDWFFGGRFEGEEEICFLAYQSAGHTS
jgi:hypothetical protein